MGSPMMMPQQQPWYQPGTPIAQAPGSTMTLRLDDANAKLFLDGRFMHATGFERRFTLPNVQPGTYRYTVRVIWSDGGETSNVVEWQSGRDCEHWLYGNRNRAERKESPVFGLLPERMGKADDPPLMMASENGRTLIGGPLTGPKDDAALPSVTVCAKNAGLLALGMKAVEAVKDKAKIQGYDLSNANCAWAVAPFKLDQDPSYVAKGFKAILQGPTEAGTKAKILDEVYDPAELPGALRKIDPNFPPSRPSLPGLPSIPDWLKPHLDFKFDTDTVILIGILAIGLIIMTRKGK
jgi:hypothetical protein